MANDGKRLRISTRIMSKTEAFSLLLFSPQEIFNIELTAGQSRQSFDKASPDPTTSD